MKKKIFSFVLIILIAISLIFLSGCSEQKNAQEVTGSGAENQTNNVQTAENTLNQFFNFMKNADFTSAANLFNEDEYSNFMSQQFSDLKSVRETLEDCYNEFGSMYSAQITGIDLIENVDEFNNVIGNSGTSEEEYNELLGNYRVYRVGLSIDSETADDIYILTDDNKIVSSATLISYCATNNSVNTQAGTAASEVEKNAIKTEFDMAFIAIYLDYVLNGNGVDYADYCTKEVIQAELSDATIETLTWNNNIGTGTVKYNNNTYNFTLTLTGKTSIDVTIE